MLLKKSQKAFDILLLSVITSFSTLNEVLDVDLFLTG